MKRPPKLPPEKRRLAALAAAMLVAAAFVALSQAGAGAAGGPLGRLTASLGGS